MLVYERIMHVPSPKGCVIFLPGREKKTLKPGKGMLYSYLLENLKKMGLEDYLIEVLQPSFGSWYPLPKPDQMEETLYGINEAVRAVESILNRVEVSNRIPREKTVLVGFSAGAVVAIQVAAKSDQTFARKSLNGRFFAGILAFAGAVFDPQNLPEVGHRTETAFHLFHNRDDDVFSWEERFLPTQRGLKWKGFNVVSHTNDKGGHEMPIYGSNTFRSDIENLRHVGKIIKLAIKSVRNIPENLPYIE